MLKRIRRSMEEKDQGFTLIELLVVMIIIGILAAIAVPVFLNQRAKARDTATKSDVSNAGREIATYYVDGTDKLSGAISGTTMTVSNVTAPIGVVATIKVSDGTAPVASTAAIRYYTGAGCTNSNGWLVTFTNPNGSGTPSYTYQANGGLITGSPTNLAVACS